MQYTKNFRFENLKFSAEKDIFNIVAQNIDREYTIEPPRRDGSNEYPQSMFWSKNKIKCFPEYIPVLLYIKVGYKVVYGSF